MPDWTLNDVVSAERVLKGAFPDAASVTVSTRQMGFAATVSVTIDGHRRTAPLVKGAPHIAIVALRAYFDGVGVG